MKLNKWLFGAAAALMLGACSDNLSDEPNGGSNSGNPQITEGEGYIGISLQLPEQPSTRAANDIFDDGLPSEYKVERAALLLFWGRETDGEANAEFIGAYPIGSDERFDQPNGDNITTSFQDVATLNKKIDKKENDGMQLWGMAIVNYDKSIFKVISDPKAAGYGTLKVLAKTIDPDTETLSSTATEVEIPIRQEETKDADDNIITAAVPGMKFSEFRKFVTAQPLYTKDGYGATGGGFEIFMTNAPLSDKPGETTNPGATNSTYTIQTLAKLDASKISTVIETARVNPAGCIFVERAVSKITLSHFPLQSTLKYQQLTQSEDGTIVAVGDPSEVTLKIINLGWLLDNEEKDSYIVRNAQKYETDNCWTLFNNSKYRFVGSAKMNTPANSSEEIAANHNWFRTYWCKDPSYANGRTFNEQATTSSTYPSLLKNGIVDPDAVLYSRENTFSVNYQNYRNTTRVVFKVQYEWIETDEQGNEHELNVYCKAGDPSIIYKQSDAKMFILSPFISSNTIHDFVLNNVDGEKAVKNGIAKKTEVGDQTTYNISYGISDFITDFGTVLTTDNGKLLQMTSVTLNPGSALAQSLKDGVSPTSTVVTSALNSAKNDANDKVAIRSFADENAENSNICYYATNIQHFGDTYCPIPKDAAGKFVHKGVTTTAVYENNNPTKYLGRWGMVRNNWYDLNIGRILNMGYADVPNGDVTTSDDNEEEQYYLAAKVHVLSWARRTQSVDF